MNDLIYVLVILGFFWLAWVYTLACDRLVFGAHGRVDQVPGEERRKDGAEPVVAEETTNGLRRVP